MISDRSFASASALFDAATSIAVVGHIRPDADAIGSVCAVVLAARSLGKQANGFIGQPEALASNLSTIPGGKEVRTASELPEADLIVVVDCGSIDRTGAFADQIAKANTPVIVIDHHASNSGYGSVCLIDHEAESTTTVLRRWFKLMGISMDSNIAKALYAGLVTDTGSFRWGRPNMHDMAAELVKFGVDTRQMAADLLDFTSLDGLKMIGRALAAISLHPVGNRTMAVIYAPYADVAGLETSEVESLVDFARGVTGADIGAVFKEYRPEWFAVSLRTMADIDVSVIATRLGGGGHLRAAGYTTEGSFERCLSDLKEAVCAAEHD